MAQDAPTGPARPLPPSAVPLVRRIVTTLGLPRVCPVSACRRARACRGRHMPCHAALADELRPIIRSVVAHAWHAAEMKGEAPDVAPAARDDRLRLLAAEADAVARLADGTGEDDGSPYALWLRNVVAPHLRRRGLVPAPALRDDGRPHDPDAKLAP